MTSVDGSRRRRLWQLAVETLDANWEGDHTVPSRTLYPHQWSWDSAFIAIGLAHVAPERAWRELETLFAAQWRDGRVPHIVFNPRVRVGGYFPGPQFWDSAVSPAAPPQATSGIVQPPVHAIAAWHVYRRDPSPAAGRRLAALYPKLVAAQHYLRHDRDVGGAGLVCLVHPWEAGLDNSPAWDAPMAAVPADPELMRRHRRHDTRVAAAEQRPTDVDYARYIVLVDSYRQRRYLDAGLAADHPFLVECPLFNALTAAAEYALADIAEVVGADPAAHREAGARLTEVLGERLWDPRSGTFHVRDLRTDVLLPSRTVLGLGPLLLPGLPSGQVEALVAEATSDRFGVAEVMSRPLPSYDRSAADFDPVRYWRGPSWINICWLVREGLLRHGHPALAAGLAESMIDLVDRAGCHEYFEPNTGAGLGSPAFSWSAALLLDVLAATE